MNVLEVLVKALPAIVPAIALVIATTQGADHTRRTLLHDAEVASKLPDGDAKTALLDLIKREVEELSDTTRRRDLPMLGVSIIAAPLLGWLAIWSFTQGGWWRLLSFGSALAALLFTYGVFESARVIPRDSKGVATEPGASDQDQG